MVLGLHIMKNIWNKIKTYWNKFSEGFWAFTLKHEKCLYTFFITCLVFFSVIIYQTSNHTSDYLQWQKEKALLERDLSVATEIITLQGELLRKKDFVIREQQEVIGKAKQIIELQEKALQDLMKRLRPPVDPSRWAIYEAN